VRRPLVVAALLACGSSRPTAVTLLPAPTPSATPTHDADASTSSPPPTATAPDVDANVALGDRYFADNKLDLAERAYEEVIKLPPPANRNYGYAWYKLAYIAWNKADYARALFAFKKVADFGNAFSQISGATRLADTARKDVVPVYAQVGAPTRAYEFFSRMTVDPQAALAMTAALGAAYLDQGAFANAATIYRELAVRDPVHKCRWDAYARHASTRTPRAALDAALARCP